MSVKYIGKFEKIKIKITLNSVAFPLAMYHQPYSLNVYRKRRLKEATMHDKIVAIRNKLELKHERNPTPNCLARVA